MVTVTLNNSTNVSNLLVTFTGTGLIFNQNSCVLSSLQPSCSVTITGESQVNTVVTASTANGYFATSPEFKVNQIYLYTLGAYNNKSSILVYKVNQGTGFLTYTEESTSSTNGFANIVVNRNYLYAIDNFNGSIIKYNINLNDGSLLYAESFIEPGFISGIPQTLIKFSGDKAYTMNSTYILRYSVDSDGNLAYDNYSVQPVNNIIINGFAINQLTNTLYMVESAIYQYSILPTTGNITYTNKSYKYSDPYTYLFSIDAHNNSVYAFYSSITSGNHGGDLYHYSVDPDNGNLTESSIVARPTEVSGGINWKPLNNNIGFLPNFAYISNSGESGGLWVYKLSLDGNLVSLNESALLPKGINNVRFYGSSVFISQ